MAKATVAQTPTFTLTLNEAEAQVVFALTGRVGSNNDAEGVYTALSEALGYPYEAAYEVNSNNYGDRASTLYLVKR